MTPKYNIGDVVWYARRETTTDKIMCPECFGKKVLTVILGDGSQVIIDCMGCAPGLENPRGYCTFYKQSSGVKEIIISGVEYNIIKTTYQFDGCYSVNETELFDTKEGAEKKAVELAEEHNKEELDRIHRKEKNNKNWAWHVHYYRNKIRRALEDIEHAKARLNIAKKKLKTEKKEIYDP